MHKIKKYLNNRFYNTTERRYLSKDKLAELIRAGEAVSIVDNRTGRDITARVVAEFTEAVPREEKAGAGEKDLLGLLRKGGGSLLEFAKRTTGLWQNALTMAEDELERLVNRLVREKELSVSEGSKLKGEMVAFGENLRVWIGERVDQRFNQLLGAMKLPTRDQVRQLSARVEALSRKVAELEAAAGKGGPAAESGPGTEES